MEFSAKQIAELLNGTIEGNEQAKVCTFAKIEEGVSGAISFLANPKYTHYIYTTQSSVVLVNKDFEATQAVNTTLIRVDNAYESIAKLLKIYESMTQKKSGISSLAQISNTAKIGKNCYIGAFVYIGDNVEVNDGVQIYPNSYVGDNVKIGENSIIYANVSIYQGCVIGQNNIFHSGVVVGADGFGFAPTSEGYEKIPQIGVVITEDNVELGANTCVDRSTMGATIIRKGVKLDNLVQIAHNVEVGSNTVMSAQTGVAGSAKVGEWCMFGGQVGIAGHMNVGNNVKIGAQSGVHGRIKDGEILMGTPGIDHKMFLKAQAMYKRLPEIYYEMRELQREINELKSKIK